MRHLFRALIALALITIAARIRAQGADAAAHYEHLRNLTQLDRPGAQPFHLKVDAQLYDLKGNPAETGTIEEWWASPSEYRIEINSGLIHEIQATGEPDQAAPLTRASYLLNQLFQETVHPLGALDSKTTVTEGNWKFENADLTCLKLRDPFHLQAGPLTFCSDAGTENLRVGMHDFEMAIRNVPGTFRGTNVAVATIISYFGRKAISGRITVIERLKPGAPLTPAPQPASTEAASSSIEQLSRKGSGGHIRKRTNPIYPSSARKAHIEGTVLVHAVITKKGDLTSLVVLASPDDALSQAALDAVRNWRCDPYRLNGKPTEVSTTIPVVFKLDN